MTRTAARSPASDGPAVGVDLGGTKTCAALVLPDGRLRCEIIARTPAAAGSAAVVDLVVDLVSQVRRAAGATTPTAVGIGSAGVIDPRSGAVLGATSHIAGWGGTPLARQVAQRTGLPVRAINDVQAHAIGEVRYGAGRGLGSLLVVAAGTGIGGSLVTDGTPLIGTHCAAGHLGHVPAAAAEGLPCSCGAVGHLEAVASGPGLLALYRRRGGSAEDAQQVAAAASAGDARAGDCLDVAGRALGRAIGGWVNMLDPNAVVVTGGLAQAGGRWWQAVRDGADHEYIDAVRSCRILPSGIGPRAAILGAAAYARDDRTASVSAGAGVA